MKLIVDAGPIIALSKVGALGVLPELFDEVLVPREVMREVAPRGETRPGAEVGRLPWIRVLPAAGPRGERVAQAFDLGAGEAAAIAAGLLDPAASLLLMDDARGLASARAKGLNVLRTGALLVLAAEERILTAPEVVTAIAKLSTERYLGPKAARDVLALLKSRLG